MKLPKVITKVPIKVDVILLNEDVGSTGTSLLLGALYITTLVIVPSSFTVNVIVSSLNTYPSGAIVSVRV